MEKQIIQTIDIDFVVVSVACHDPDFVLEGGWGWGWGWDRVTTTGFDSYSSYRSSGSL